MSRHSHAAWLAAPERARRDAWRPTSAVKPGKAVMVIALALATGTMGVGAQMTPIPDAELNRLRDNFEQRCNAMVQLLAGQPLKTAKKRPPLGPDRALYTRHYSYSIICFAMKAFWLNEFLDEANAALQEDCRYYIDNAQARNDRDSFYWAADVLCRLLEFFGRNGTRAAGRLNPDTEDLMLEMMWQYCRDCSRLADADHAVSRTWHVWESENHHVQGFSTLWHFCRFLKDAPTYSDRDFSAGGNAERHYQVWTEYSKEYLRERVRKGLFVEMANKGYNAMTLKGIYNFHDFADDLELRRLSSCLLDLYWATWAEEQIAGVRGGAGSRVYPGRMSQQRNGDGIGRWAGFYLGRGTDKPPSNNEFTVLTSGYRMPLVVMDLALDAQGRGTYEIRQRRLGLALPGHNKNPDYRLRTDDGGILRYTYCTSDFIMGTAMLTPRPVDDWTLISAQNRWHGVIFAGHDDARIFPQCEARGKNTYNQQWSVQHKGTLIAQKLPGSISAGDMRVWFAKSGLTSRVERNGWVFVEAAGAYAAVRPAAGGYAWDPVTPKLAGDWLRCLDEWAPVLIEVARKADVRDYGAFQQQVIGAPRRFQNRLLDFRGLGGDRFRFYADHSKPPEVNGTPIDYAPAMVFDSPFIKSEWNSGRVTIRKGGRELLIDVDLPEAGNKGLPSR